jgi:hypothetical protein
MANRPGGFGQEAVGDPFGAGGDLHVVRARCVEGQTVRVVFDEEPIHVSPSGKNDALNPANYSFAILAPASAVTPQAVGVKPLMIIGPAAGPVLSGDERAFDVQTDRQLISGIGYSVTANAILSKFGGPLGAPVTANFVGMVNVQNTQLPPRRLGFADIASDPFNGGYIVDNSGDIAPHTGIDSLRKRIFRRMVTVKDAFKFLPGYGLGLALKRTASVREIGKFKTDLVAQVKQEPEVANVQASVTFNPIGVLTVSMLVKTKTGALLEVNATANQGRVVIA